ncbi:MAG: TlyA family RNA methyltransferase [Mycobacteriales bacterium]
MARRGRLDAELVRRGLARSRQEATELVASGAVRVNGEVARKAATMVAAATPVLLIADTGVRMVSRGAHKLVGALRKFGEYGLSVAGRRCLDAGASTGGFTQVLLDAGASEVVAVDVGCGQLAWKLRSDERVEIFDRTNVRTLESAVIGGAASLVVADLSFISLRLVLPALLACTQAGGDVLPMVKPQFEVGRGQLGSGGVVREPQLHAAAVLSVAAAAAQHGWGVVGMAPSPLPGPAGNREFFLWLRDDAAPVDPEAVNRMVATPVSPAPSVSAPSDPVPSDAALSVTDRPATVSPTEQA